MRSRFHGFTIVALAALSLGGCAGFGRGLGEALIESTSKEDQRQCWIRGRPFPGIVEAVDRQGEVLSTGVGQRPSLKVLMVHGIGAHSPGYATRLGENLARTLSLDKVEEKFKEYVLMHPRIAAEKLGTLRVTRYFDGEGVHEMLFYELTWDPIVEAEKQTVAFDNSGEYSFRRTSINNTFKMFVNETVPDVLMYNGKFRESIQTSIAQAMCWMVSETWAGLPESGEARCDSMAPDSLDQIDDDFIFISHSLGSRITTDALQTIAARSREVPDLRPKAKLFQQKIFPVFMLSNQLPLLQLGQNQPEVHGEIDTICQPRGGRAGERLFRETRIIAFSDPNDLFSYAIPPRFADDYVDSRLCPSITNVIINVAPIKNIPGFGSFANPYAAHVEYDRDERVLALIAHGIGNDSVAPVIRERCEWIEAVPDGR